MTLFNARLNVRLANGDIERRTLANPADYSDALHHRFGLDLSDADIGLALETVARNGEKGAPHPFFA